MKTLPLQLVAALALAGCATPPPSDAELDRMAAHMMQTSFRDQGIAKLDRIQQDFTQAACSSDKPPGAATVARIEAEAKASIKWPAGGQYLGDWREGEKIAQNGRGMTWTDSSTAPSANGGNCYNCHQISKQEISFGTIGPSPYQYGKKRGITGTDAPAAQEVFAYTWTKIYNSHALNACSSMPRFGAMHLLDEAQMKHLMALLLDPKSPVNQ